MRYHKIFGLFCISAVLLAGTGRAAERNIVLFVADDHGQDAGCYGNEVLKTPHMDRLAKEGTLFTHAFATTASCSASRSVILTGMHNHANAQYGHTHHFHHFESWDWLQSLPMILSKGGYRTARIGKYHVAPESSYQFETVLRGNDRNPVQMANASRGFIESEDDRPFFLYICSSDPHRGGGAARELPESPDRFGNPAPGRSYEGIEEVVYDPKDVQVPPFLPDTPATRAELAQYYQSISRIDQGVGQLLKHLEEAGVLDKTLFVYISDHGIAMPGAKTTVYEPGLRSPCVVRNPYATGARSGRGVRSEAMISWVDLTPTLLDFAGLLEDDGKVLAELEMQMPIDPHRPGSRKVPYGFHGRSFLQAIVRDEAAGFDEIYASHTFHEITMYYPMRVVRTRDWKLIWNIAHPLPYPFATDLWAAPTWQTTYKNGMDAMYGVRSVRDYIHRPEFELYKISDDPHESKNLAGDPSQASRLAQLKEKLKEFQKNTNDPWIMKWEYE